MDRSDSSLLVQRAASASTDPLLDEELRIAFSGLSDDSGIDLITSLDVASFCAVGLRLAAALPADRTDMILRAFDKVANLARLEGRRSEARLAFETKLILSPHDHNVRFAIAEYLEQEGNLTEAYEVMKPGAAAINHHPAWLLFIRVALAVGDVDAAAPYIERLFALDPTDPELRRLKREAASAIGSKQLGVPGLDEASIIKAVNAIAELDWPPTLGDALAGVAGRPEAGMAVKAMVRLFQWRTTTDSDRGDLGRKEDAQVLAAVGAESFLAEALARAPVAADGHSRDWLESARRYASTARDLDKLLIGLCASRTERGVVWHLRQATELLKDPANFLKVLNAARTRALADAFHSCRNLHPAIKAEASQLLDVAAGANEDLVEVLFHYLRQLGYADEAERVIRLALRRDNVSSGLLELQAKTLFAEGRETEAKGLLLRSQLQMSDLLMPYLQEDEKGHAPGFYQPTPRDLDRKADQLLADGHVGDAMRVLLLALKRLAEDAPTDAELRCDLLIKHGDLALHLGATEIALNSYREAYRLRPARLTADRQRSALAAAGNRAAAVASLPSDAPELVGTDQDDIDDREAQEGNRILYFITWHDDPSSLVRLLTALHDDLNYYFISIGGRSTSEEVDQLLSFAQATNIFLFKGSPTSWGGRKLLFENAFAAIDFLLAAVPNCRWMQLLCNQCYPLVSQPEARRRLAGDTWPAELHTPPPPTVLETFYSAGKSAFSDVHDAVHSVLRRADSRGLSFPDFLHFAPIACTFNFSGQPQAMNMNFKAKGLNYWVKPHSVDLRTMGLGRFVEISDVVDDGGTYTRLLAPRHAQAVHSILRKYHLYTGDPFVLISRSQAEFLMTDPTAHELYLAMAHEFAPEMNYFDTVRLNSPFKNEPAHSFFRGRRNDLIVNGDDIDGAIGSSKLFTRKITSEHGKDFARYFGERIAAERPELARCWSVTISSEELSATALRSLRSLIPWPSKQPWLLRDLHGKPLARILPFEDGSVLNEDGSSFGSWSWDVDGALLLNGATGTPPVSYRQVTSVDGKFILVPDSLVWIGSDWGRFLEQPIAAEWMVGSSSSAVRLTLCAAKLREPLAVLREGKSEYGVAIAGFSNVPDDPMIADVRQFPGECEHIGQAEDGTILGRFVLDDALLILRLRRALLTGARQVFVFTRATAEEHDLSFQLADGVEFVFDEVALFAQPWWVRSRRFPRWRELRFNPDGEVSVEGCGTTGFARLQHGQLIMADVADWAICELPQIAWTEHGWHLSGYGQYDLSEDDYLHIVTRPSGERPE